ncbi:MAG: MOSC domain-containing protein [Ignavibacteria bacterium]|nr:MOSC domain-containing protein [Ignavibacteria bacterium]
MNGKVKAISISTQKGVPKTNVKEAKLIKGHGIEGDIHSGKWHRQVSLLAFESIEKMMKSGFPNLRPGSFAENITTQSIDIHNIKKGARIIIGEDAELEITQIGKECHSKCSINIEVGDCIMPKEGIFAKVITGGRIKAGDKIFIVG